MARIAPYLLAALLVAACGDITAPATSSQVAPSFSVAEGGTTVLYGAVYEGKNGLSSLYIIDSETAAMSLVGEIGFERVSALEYDGTTNTLFGTGERSDGSDTHVLITIDPFTGIGTEVGPTGVADFLGLYDNTDTFSDLAFAPNGTLLAFGWPGGALASVDISSGSATQIAYNTTPLPNNDLGLLADGGDGISFSNFGTLFHVGGWGGATVGPLATLHTLDPATSFALTNMPLTWPADPGIPDTEAPRANALDHDPESGVLFASVRYGFSRFGGIPSNFLATIDVATGNGTLIGQTLDGLDALVWVDMQDVIQSVLDEALDTVDVNGNVSGSLASKLENVLAKLDTENVSAAVNQLQAFINQVQALVNGGDLTSEEGSQLIGMAQAVIDQLSG